MTQAPEVRSAPTLEPTSIPSPPELRDIKDPVLLDMYARLLATPKQIEFLKTSIYKGDSITYHVGNADQHTYYANALDAMEAIATLHAPRVAVNDSVATLQDATLPVAIVLIEDQPVFLTAQDLQILAIEEVRRGTLQFAMLGLAYLPMTIQPTPNDTSSLDNK